MPLRCVELDDSTGRRAEGVGGEAYAHKHLMSAPSNQQYSRVTRVMAVRFELSSSLGGLRWAACRAYTDEESMLGRPTVSGCVAGAARAREWFGINGDWATSYAQPGGS